MKVLLVSDNHGEGQILDRIAQTFGDQVDLMMHCGDSNLDPSTDVMTPFLTVEGNTDWGFTYPEIQRATVDHEKVVVTHGDHYSVNSTLTPLSLLAEAEAADVVGYGHTHQLAVTTADNHLLINPGSISQPRGEYAYIGGTFAIVEVTTAAWKVQYYNRDMQPIEELAFDWQR